MTLVSLIGNSLILWVLWTLPDVRSSTNILIGNMALAGLPTCIIYCCVGIYKFISRHNFLAGAFMCQYELTFKFGCLTAGNLSLVTMAADRLKNFYWPSSRRITPRATLLICIVIWLFSTAFGFLFSSVRRLQHNAWNDFDEDLCIDASKKHYDLWLICLAFLVYVPILTMVVLYSLIVRKLCQFEERLFRELEGESGGSAAAAGERRASGGGSTSGTPTPVERPASYSRPVLHMIWIYLIVTIICYIPFQFLLIRREIVYPTMNENVSESEQGKAFISVREASATLFNRNGCRTLYMCVACY